MATTSAREKPASPTGQERAVGIAAHGHFRLPDTVDLKVRPGKGSQYKLIYQEGFLPGKEAETLFQERLRESVKMVSQLGIGKVTPGKHGMRLEITGSREDIGNALVAEFIGWSTLGTHSIRDLFGIIAFLGAQVKAARGLKPA